MLGADVQAAARAAGHQLVALTHAELDITDADAVRARITQAHPDVIVNCAAYTNVDGAEGDGRELAYAVNATGAGNLARAAATARAQLLHISSDYVFDGTKRSGPYLESDPPNPRSVYGASKLAGERAVAREAPHLHTIVRSSWLFGNHGACFPDTIIRLAGSREQLTVVDDQRGCPTFTVDLAGALLKLAARPPLGIVHLAAAGCCSWFELARATLALIGSATALAPCATVEFPRPAPRPAYSVLRSERAAALPALRHWQDALGEYVRARQAGALEVHA